MLAALSSHVEAEKLKAIYEGLVLSRLLFAADAWYPFTTAEDRNQLQSIHYRGCCIITGSIKCSHGPSVCYEAGFRMLDEIVHDKIVALADRLRRAADDTALAPRGAGNVTRSLGVDWITRLFRDQPMPTATLRLRRWTRGRTHVA